MRMYTQEQIITALKCRSVTRTICVLSYPTRRALYTWIKDDGSHKTPRKVLCNINTRNHPRNPSLEVKMSAIHYCFELGESIKFASENIGYSRASIYNWRKRYLHRETTALLNHKNIRPGTLTTKKHIPTNFIKLYNLNNLNYLILPSKSNA
jgi:transposase-like protein